MSVDPRHRPLIVTDGIGGAHRSMADGFDYFLRRWSAPGIPRATMILLHGLGAHSGWYAQLGAALGAHGIASYAFDLPGHGYTQGARGDIDRIERITLILDDTLRLATREQRATPVFLGGLSLGGILTLREAVRRGAASPFVGYVAMSPPIIDTYIPPLDKLAMFARLPFAPQSRARCPLGYGVRIAESDIAQNAAAADRLALRDVTLRTYWNILSALVPMVRGTGRICAPVLMMVGGRDHVGSPAAMRWLARRIGRYATLREYAEWGHDLKLEPIAGQLAQDMAEWMTAQGCPPRVG